jgi:hypothetical protein
MAETDYPDVKAFALAELDRANRLRAAADAIAATVDPLLEVDAALAVIADAEPLVNARGRAAADAAARDLNARLDACLARVREQVARRDRAAGEAAAVCRELGPTPAIDMPSRFVINRYPDGSVP